MKIEQGECDGKITSYGENLDEDVCVVELLDTIGVDATDKASDIRR